MSTRSAEHPGPPAVTRGHGRLEAFLSRQRAAMADRLIPGRLRGGTILDIGCGSYPYFLSRTPFARRIGIDRNVANLGGRSELAGVELLDHDLNSGQPLPFADASLDVVTMLAVFEHIPLDLLRGLLREINRVLKPEGCYILTTPAGWTGPVLWGLKHLGLVSRDEIDEHTGSYGPGAIRKILSETPLGRRPVQFGYFECFMNVWGRVGCVPQDREQGDLRK